jgi:hypothetical protein
MSKLSSKNVYVQWNGLSLVASGTSFNVPQKQEMTDASTFASNYKSNVPTMKSINADMEIIAKKYDQGGLLIEQALKIGTEGDLLWGWEGNATGKPKSGARMMVTEISKSGSVGEMVKLKVAFEMVGDDLLFNEADGDVWG